MSPQRNDAIPNRKIPPKANGARRIPVNRDMVSYSTPPTIPKNRIKQIADKIAKTYFIVNLLVIDLPTSYRLTILYHFV